MMYFKLIGRLPRVLIQASALLTWVSIWPLSSVAPRATMLPSRRNGSNGGEIHWSNGSGGCTS